MEKIAAGLLLRFQVAGFTYVYRYGGHIEFIRFEEYYGMPRGHEHDPIYRYSLSIDVRFSGQCFLTFPRKRL